MDINIRPCSKACMGIGGMRGGVRGVGREEEDKPLYRQFGPVVTWGSYKTVEETFMEQWQQF